MSNSVVIRPYRPEDRIQVREIACDTADAGQPVDRLFRDRQTVADWLTHYYTEHEPQSLCVAQADQVVAGYLMGCLDTRRCNRITTREVLPKAVFGAVARGALWHGEAWQLFLGLVATALIGGAAGADLNRYPSHLHINLRPEFRGRGIGAQLIERFRQRVEEAGGRGIHVTTLGHNHAGRKFFERMGFRLLHEQPLILPAGRWYRRTSTAVYGWMKEN